MNIKKKTTKLMSLLLSFAMTFSGVIPAYAMENTNGNSTAVIDGEDISADERNLEDITVTYKQASSFFVTIPKTIVLDGWKKSTYAVKVSGDIDAEQCVYVAPVDGIDETENIDFYMKDQASENAKDDVVADVTHKKSHWNAAEVAASYRQDDNVVSAPDLTAGAWRGIFQMEIKLETHVIHKHNYVETITKEPTCTETGEKKYTCDCGDSYTEEIPVKGHHFENGECTDCGEKDPNHEHSYTETINKQPTCTEKGEKTYTCGCGHSYTEEIPAKGHNFVDGTCTNCGKETDPYETAPASAYSNWDYTLDDTNNIITLNYYKGSETDVIVYANYVVGGKTYKTQIASNPDEATYNTPYMFNGTAQANCKNIQSITFSKDIDTSNVTNMSRMFSNCYALTALDVTGFNTNNVTNMCMMFYACQSLTSLELSNFDTSNVTSMDMMFRDCRALTSLDLSNFDTSQLIYMSQMFLGCSSLTSLNLSNWDTSNVTRMEGTFRECTKLTSLDLSSFDTSKVTDMRWMFMDSSILKTIYVTRGKWSTSLAASTETQSGTLKLAGTHYMFKNCGTSSVAYK